MIHEIVMFIPSRTLQEHFTFSWKGCEVVVYKENSEQAPIFTIYINDISDSMIPSINHFIADDMQIHNTARNQTYISEPFASDV